jgi:NADH:ubiquinone oxidoreductase subunit 5 (subunit L)/multisubunit Na+/H+ antiporter MnhA subunit
LILSLSGATLAVCLYLFNINFFIKSNQNKYTLAFINFLMKKWYFDKMYNQHIGLNVLNQSYQFTYKDIDRGLIEFFGPFNIVKTLQLTMKNSSQIEPNLFIKSLSYLLLLCVYIIAWYTNYIDSVYISIAPIIMLFAFIISKK